MVKITQHEAEQLKKHKRNKDIHVHNKTHKSHAKTYYLTESKASLNVLKSLRRYESDT